MAEEQIRIEATIVGRVQGVGFRAFTRRSARSLDGVTGWVRNESDGSVTLVAEGERDQVSKLLEQVREGPRSARVEDIDFETKPASNEFSSFSIRY